MGVVWAARDLRSEERVALKFLKAGEGGEAGIRRFVREARAAMALSHPNIVHVHTLTADRHGSPVMVMDLLEGESLATRLRRVRRLEVSTLAGILVQIVSAVGAAHAAGIVHRDLKPDNVFLVGEPPSVRVLDFGIAKLTAREGDAAASTALTNTGAMLGTPFYMAPEQVFGERDLDHRADVWALGVIAYECLSGRRPFEGENFGQVFKAVTRGQLVPLRSIAADLPSDVLDVVDRMLTTDRDRRADLHAVLAVFERHTDRRVDTFAAPTLPIDALPDDAFAPTIAAATPALEGQTPGVLMRSAPPPSVSSTPRAADAGLNPSRRGLFTFVALAVVAALGGAYWFGGRRGAIGAASATSVTSESTPPQPSASLAASVSAPPTPPPVSAPPAASPAVKAIVAAPKTASIPAPLVASSVTSVPTVASTVAAPPLASSGKKTLAGGVVEPPPF